MAFDYKSIEPIKMSDRGWVCNRHYLKICPFCTVDYSFLDELSDDEPEEYVEEDLEEDAEMDKNTSDFGDDPAAAFRDFEADMNPVVISQGAGRVFPAKFASPSSSSTPGELFPPGVSLRAIPNVHRFIRRGDPTQCLIYVDGACLNNGQANPKAGWAFVFKPSTDQQRPGAVSGRLENKGPFGGDFSQTSNRAELRAVVGALQFRHWEGEGFSTLVIATDSEYVVQGATTWARGWVRNGWKTRYCAEAKNKDLWKLLLGLVAMKSRHGLEIQFWRIPRALNETADRAAKQAAEGQDEDLHCCVVGMLV